MKNRLKAILEETKLEHLLPLFADQAVKDDIINYLDDSDLEKLEVNKLSCQRSLQNAPPVVTSKCTTFDGCFSRFFGFVLARGFSVPLRGGVRGTVVPCLVV